MQGLVANIADKLHHLHCGRCPDDMLSIKREGTHPHELGLVALLLHWHCGTVWHILQAIVCGIVQGLPDLVLPGIVRHRNVHLQIIGFSSDLRQCPLIHATKSYQIFNITAGVQGNNTGRET